jgi:demethylmenaquinone methyltransferase / 2-methoxy-6-polyprenyl-1,4-benzoquinol methylase
MEIKPYQYGNQDKKTQVTRMFNTISGKYDLLNHLLSFNVDKYWRWKAIKQIRVTHPNTILDLATGTADLAVASLGLKPESVTGIDISEEMIKAGRKKLWRKNLAEKVELMLADAENLPFADDSFDVVLSGFGVRNFTDLRKGMNEAKRVLKNEGQLVILEFSKPLNSLFGKLFRFYFSNILPRVGGKISGDQTAYVYLHESVESFPEGNTFLRLLQEEGFSHCTCKRLTFGIVSIYSGFKKQFPE